MSPHSAKPQPQAQAILRREHAFSVNNSGYLIGIDVGSTTVKAVVCTDTSRVPLYREYSRHESRQAETVLDVLQKAKGRVGMADDSVRLFMTGSGGQHLARLLGARFVQEVAAVSLAVERAYPDVRSVIELGGQDAKMILSQEGGVEGRRKKIATMNDKCAGGTGVIIEKIASRLHVSREELLTASF